MIETQLVKRGISDEAVLSAMATVPRHLFVPERMRMHAYEDRALPLDNGQTISQPFIVALMAELLKLKSTDCVLEIGVGSGYSAAVLSTIATEVYSIERIEPLASTARDRLHELGYENVYVFVGDGTYGLSEHAPFDAITVAAASPWVPHPLREQLAENGRLVIPVGGHQEQLLLRLTKHDNTITTERLGGVRFVPLLGGHSWEEQ